MMREICILVLGLFLLGNKSTVDAQTESQQPPPCNSCCQGPAGSQGTPGIPGVPGTNGIPGNIGPRGERGDNTIGEAGPRGEKGDTGEPGLQGERGEMNDIGHRGIPGPIGRTGPVGSPGPVGIAGPKGSRGHHGEMGVTGHRGDKGQKGEIGRSRVSAFSAVRINSFTSSRSGEALPFERVHTNVGDDFVATTGEFTCTIPGIYLFTYNIGTKTFPPRVQLMMNEVKINSVFRSKGSNDIVSNTAVLQLDTGNVVWLKVVNHGKIVFSTTELYTSFSGVLLHEI
ncbi:uncharacterized protein [Amphiura filiformis]|uniref:uncharacterized protein n=1 Tax=Amphiura filiformis TaxID=82378 RepID=UPI003B22626F